MNRIVVEPELVHQNSRDIVSITPTLALYVDRHPVPRAWLVGKTFKVLSMDAPGLLLEQVEKGPTP